MSNQINMWAKCSEPVHLRKTDSYSEKERFHYSFKLIESTRNALVKKVCEAACETLPTQFASKGGSPEFEAWLIKYLPSAKFVFTTDIPNCFNGILFGSVLNGLPLPGPVLERVLKDTRLRAKPLINGKVGILSEELLLSIKQSVEASSSGRGIPIGAAGSAIAAEIVIKGILQAIAAETHGVRCAAHADNLIFLADDKKAIPSLIKVLHNQVSMHFGTDVTDELARRNTITPADDEFLFCGIHYCSKEGQLIKRLEEKRLYDFAVKIDVGIDEAVSVDDFDKLALRVKGWLRSRQFSLKAIGVGADLMQEIGMRKAQLSSS
ncbi:MAG: hypothetical protein ABJK59_02040 [Erythrobacter sp.]|uniref:hypothetical protein n=1 Tax=Erythrobacter sp. TaxID=1042 RepID=UPI0032982DF8